MANEVCVGFESWLDGHNPTERPGVNISPIVLPAGAEALATDTTYDRWVDMGPSVQFDITVSDANPADVYPSSNTMQYIAAAGSPGSGATTPFFQINAYVGPNRQGMELAFVRGPDVIGAIIPDGTFTPAQFSQDYTIRIGGTTGSSVAALKVGRLMRFPRGIYVGHDPIRLSERDVIRPRISRSGQFLGKSIVRRGRSGRVRIRHVPPDFVRSADFLRFKEHARSRPFFLWWRPDDYPDEVEYVWTERPIRVRNTGPAGLVSIEMTLGAFAP